MGNDIINGIEKRDGTIEEFDMDKIAQAIIKARTGSSLRID